MVKICVAEVETEQIDKWIECNSSDEIKEALVKAILFNSFFIELICDHVDLESLSPEEKEMTAKYMTNVLFIGFGITKGIPLSELKKYKYNIREEKWERMDLDEELAY